MTCPKCSGRMLRSWPGDPPSCFACGYYERPAPEVLAALVAEARLRPAGIAPGGHPPDTACDNCARVFSKQGLQRHRRYCVGAALARAKIDMKGETA